MSSDQTNDSLAQQWGRPTAAPDAATRLPARRAGHSSSEDQEIDTVARVPKRDDNESREADPAEAGNQWRLPQGGRRLSDKILVAFHQACDQGDLDVADQLLRVLEFMLTRRPLPVEGNRRRSMEGLVAAHERLWHLRHPGRDDQ